jgi:Flp pilus assembly protein TadD
MKSTRWSLLLAAAGVAGCAGSQVRPDSKESSAPTKVIVKQTTPHQAVLPPRQAVLPPRKAGQVNKPEADPAMVQGATAYRTGRYDEAKAAFEKAVEQQPKDAQVHFDLALTLEKTGDFAGARTHYERANELAPGDAPTAVNLARLYRHAGELDRAIAVYEKALQANANEASVLNPLASAYRLKKDFAKAEAAARRALVHGGEVEAYKNLALIFFDQGNYRLAELLCANARKLAPNDPGVYNDLGLVYLKEEDLPKALGQFQKAVSLDAGFAPGWVNLGAIALRYRDYAGAQKSFERAVALSPDDAALHLALAYALDGQRPADAKKGLAAGEEFEKALAIQPNNNEAICNAGWAFASDRSGFSRAKGYLEKCRTLASTQGDEKSRIDAKLSALAMMAAQPAPAEETAQTGDQDPPTDDDQTGIAAGEPAAGGGGAEAVASSPTPSPSVTPDTTGVGGAGAAGQGSLEDSDQNPPSDDDVVGAPQSGTGGSGVGSGELQPAAPQDTVETGDTDPPTDEGADVDGPIRAQPGAAGATDGSRAP